MREASKYYDVGLPFLIGGASLSSFPERSLRREGIVVRFTAMRGIDDMDFESKEASRRFHASISRWPRPRAAKCDKRSVGSTDGLARRECNAPLRIVLDMPEHKATLLKLAE